jgi:hypothetical protein
LESRRLLHSRRQSAPAHRQRSDADEAASGKGAGIGSVVGGVGGLGTTAFTGPQEIKLNSGLEMMIRTTGR